MRITFRLTFYTAGQKCGALCNKTPFNVHHLPLNVLHSQLEEWHLVQQNSFLMCTTFHSMFYTVGWKSGALCNKTPFNVHHLPLNVLHSQLEEWHLVQQNSFLMCTTFHSMFYTVGWKSGTLCNKTPFNVHHLPLNVPHSQLEEWRKTPRRVHHFPLNILYIWLEEWHLGARKLLFMCITFRSMF